MVHSFTYFWLFVVFSFCASSTSFTPGRSIVTSHYVFSVKCCRTLYTGALFESTSPDSEPEGGTAWIKDAMGKDHGGTGRSNNNPPVPSAPPSFSQSEINDMDDVIITLSKESDDAKRREKLAELFDKKLADATKETVDVNADDENNLPVSAEMPRFAQLFQLSLDRVGEVVQNAAQEKAAKRHEEDGGEIEGGDIIGQLKSPEELQLWALIDMMVQSKTMVKLHMGTLGRKGTFR
mmetsp:Transcript_24844/g.52252  ORF Transcript_24844/g.52252 Transcript_24844/m.52252 type:complete len:236 (-) Transcript_24844:266-973(-)